MTLHTAQYSYYDFHQEFWVIHLLLRTLSHGIWLFAMPFSAATSTTTSTTSAITNDEQTNRQYLIDWRKKAKVCYPSWTSESHLITPHWNLLKYAHLLSQRSYQGHLSPIQCRASAPQWHWCSGDQKASIRSSGPQNTVDLSSIIISLPFAWCICKSEYLRWPFLSLLSEQLQV